MRKARPHDCLPSAEQFRTSSLEDGRVALSDQQVPSFSASRLTPAALLLETSEHLEALAAACRLLPFFPLLLVVASTLLFLSASPVEAPQPWLAPSEAASSVVPPPLYSLCPLRAGLWTSCVLWVGCHNYPVYRGRIIYVHIAYDTHFVIVINGPADTNVGVGALLKHRNRLDSRIHNLV